MFLVNLVSLLLLVGVLCEANVDEAEHQREQPSDLRETILSIMEKQVEYSIKHDTDSLMNLFHPDIKVVMDGLPCVAGRDGTRFMYELVPEKASRINNTYEEVCAMDKDASYVYVRLHFEFVNESDENYLHGNGLFILKKTLEGYRFYVIVFNKHNQSSS